MYQYIHPHRPANQNRPDRNIDIPPPNMPTTTNTTRRAAVIGAGAAGLAMLKNLRQEGLEATAFERLPHIGGNWKFTDDPTATSVLRGKSPSQWLRSCLLIVHCSLFRQRLSPT